MTLTMAYCGQLTGGGLETVFCYGALTFGGVLRYLNLGGPRSGVEAVRARLAKGQTVALVPSDAPGVDLSPGEDDDGAALTGQFVDYTARVSEAAFQHTLLLHRCAVEPEAHEVALFFRVDEAQAQARLRVLVAGCVRVSVFPAWDGYLWTGGAQADLVRRPTVYGGADVWLMQRDGTGWERLITAALADGLLHLPD